MSQVSILQDDLRTLGVIKASGTVLLATLFGLSLLARDYNAPVESAAADPVSFTVERPWSVYQDLGFINYGGDSSGVSVDLLVDGKRFATADVDRKRQRYQMTVPLSSVFGKKVELVEMGKDKKVLSRGKALPVLARVDDTGAIKPYGFAIDLPPANAKFRPGPIDFSGTAAPGTLVQVWIKQKLVGQATANEDGVWELTKEVPFEGLRMEIFSKGVSGQDLGQISFRSVITISSMVEED
ncbi:MAG: hypothetical protein LCH41_11030 [Armatimonadetes bacterium]|nr:hypothetical protein [Armatimonadota bacterium]